jgi:hypothetical protein
VSSAFLIGNGLVTTITGARGTTPECVGAKFARGQVVRVRRLKHLRSLPELGVVAVAISPGFSPDWAWDDLRGLPRRLMAQVGSRVITYLVAFEGDDCPHILRESSLLPAPGHATAEVSFTE